MGEKRSDFLPWIAVALIFLGASLMLVSLSRSTLFPRALADAEAGPTRTREPLVPTAAPSPNPDMADMTSSIASGPVVTSTSHMTNTEVPQLPMSLGARAFEIPPDACSRFGVSIPGGQLDAYDLSALGVGWVMDWQARVPPIFAPGVEYAQTVRMIDGILRPDSVTLTTVAASQPGATWLISNEPDVRWQDNVSPDIYARLYHEAYVAIKAGDPSAIVAAGGIAQPTPLRLRYLDLALAAYQEEFGEPLPAQAWHIHNYMLREERDSWGVDIPPGIPDNIGVLYEVEDSANLQAFRDQIYVFRQWMTERGYGGQPLIVSEFGVPMPADYGFPLERMTKFLFETSRFFLEATDHELGNPDDGDRLVQRWCWFSIAASEYPTGNLVDLQTYEWTTLGQAWLEMMSHACSSKGQ